MDVIGPLAQKVEHLRKGQGNDKVIGGRGVGNGEENRRFPISDAVKLQLVIGHNLPGAGGMSKGARREPQEIKMLFAVLPLASLYFLVLLHGETIRLALLPGP